MRYATHLIASIILAVLAAACTSSSVPELATSYEAEVGRASRGLIRDQVPRILNRHRYEIERFEEHQSTIYVQTHWKVRQPLEDEVAHGYSQANTRIFIEARAISSTRAGAAEVWRVRLRAENRLRRPMGAEWEEPEITEMFKGYCDDLVQDLKTEFDSRFR
jgi:hypothetical protein